MGDAPFPEGMMDEWKMLFNENKIIPDDSHNLISPIFEWSCVMPLQRKRELAAMMDIAHSWDIRVVMEIGADKGGTLLHWVELHAEVRKVIACEIRGLPYKELFAERYPDVEFLWLEESSYTKEAVAKVKAFLGTDTIDALFIDGDKGAFDKDFALYSPLVTQNGGMVFMHDIYDRSGKSPCAKVFRELSKTHLTSTIIDLTESWMAKLDDKFDRLESTCHTDWLLAQGDDCGVGVFYF